MPAQDTTTRIEAPEHVAFEFELAGPWRRAWAYAIDLLVRGAILSALVAALMASASLFLGWSEVFETHAALGLLVWFGLEWFYHVGFEWLWDGKTPGKRVMHLRVVKSGGYPIGLQDAMLRNLLRAADLLPPVAPGFLPMPTYLLGMLVSAADSQFRRLGDQVADTLVISDRPRFLRRPPPIEPPPTLAELELVPERPRLAIEERKVLDAFVARWPDIGPGRRDEIAQEFALVLADRFGRTAPDQPARFLQLVHHRMHPQGQAKGGRP
jgi:uncharacterized RDD family membrane protein YckC